MNGHPSFEDQDMDKMLPLKDPDMIVEDMKKHNPYRNQISLEEQEIREEIMPETIDDPDYER